MKLNNLKNNPGARRKPKRVGRGPGSGHGKTSCRGHKGQKSRSGGKTRPGFEGGQMPLVRRMPKRGFRSPKRGRFEVVNVGDLNLFDEGSRVDAEALAARGIVRKRVDGIKILGRGELTKKLEVVADGFSASARKKIEEAKGTVRLPEKKREAETAKGAGDVKRISD